MTLKYVITDVVGQEATIKFSEVTVITKTKFVATKSENPDNSYQVEIVYLNTRRTRLVCHIDEYNKLQNAYDEYEIWLKENPTFEKSRLDLSMLDKILKNTIVSSTESVYNVNEEIQKGLVEMHRQMAENTVQNDRNFVNKIENQMAEIQSQMLSIQQVMKSVVGAVDAINRFVPQESEAFKTAIEKEIEEMAEEVSN